MGRSAHPWKLEFYAYFRVGCIILCQGFHGGVCEHEYFIIIYFDQELVFLNRMIDGSCNNQNPILGFHETPFLRLMPNAYDDKCSVPRGGQMNSQLPSPREISLTIPTTFERDSQ